MADQAEYSPEERAELLRIARGCIGAALNVAGFEVGEVSEHLSQPRGAFTTLHTRGDLRGCVGYIFPVRPLYRTVGDTAVSAALHDTRFPPVTAEEFPRLSIEISVLSPMQAIAPEDIEVGRHGLLITYGSRRGLLLPQVPVEHCWDANTFLQQTCHKAGLPEDAWQHGATIEAFTAEIFGD
ncbi:MAG: AmmeMemoRadiSam system protein A [Acidobacteriaceae bacterium]|nr:AmmeMemoRadiSam system protein A [Acidobacteriaceae bacterium]